MTEEIRLQLVELTAGAVRLSDAGTRIVITRDGVTIDGTLTGISVFGTLRRGEYSPHLGLTISLENTEVKMSEVPLDYRLQLARPALAEGPAPVELDPDLLHAEHPQGSFTLCGRFAAGLQLATPRYPAVTCPECIAERDSEVQR